MKKARVYILIKDIKQLSFIIEYSIYTEVLNRITETLILNNIPDKDLLNIEIDFNYKED